MPLKSSGSYDQTYHWLFKFRDDKIVEILEYLDILAVWKAFGTPEQRAIAEASTEDHADAALVVWTNLASTGWRGGPPELGHAGLFSIRPNIGTPDEPLHSL